MRKVKLHKAVSYKKKNGVYAFYTDFSFIFFKGIASTLIKKVLEAINSSDGVCVEGVPDDFIDYLLTKNIVEEVQNDN